MHLLYVDESGSHGEFNGNRAYVLAGLVLDGPSALRLTAELDELVVRAVGWRHDDDHELHAAELRRPRQHRGSPWVTVGGQVRRKLLEHALDRIGRAKVELLVETLPPSAPDREVTAYLALIARFDAWLHEHGSHGLVLSDVSRHDRDIRERIETARERRPGATRLVDAPLFLDSHTSRLLQAADLCAWATWREHGASPPDRAWAARLHPRA